MDPEERVFAPQSGKPRSSGMRVLFICWVPLKLPQGIHFLTFTFGIPSNTFSPSAGAARLGFLLLMLASYPSGKCLPGSRIAQVPWGYGSTNSSSEEGILS